MSTNKRDLRAFMRESAKTEEVVTMPGPDSIRGKDGKPVPLEIRVLSVETIREINKAYETRTIATDKRGDPYISNGEVAFQTAFDNEAASRHIIAEALVYPDLKDPELMAFFNCHEIAEMPRRVFSRSDEYNHVSRAVMVAIGGDSARDEPEKELGDAKN